MVNKNCWIFLVDQKYFLYPYSKINFIKLGNSSTSLSTIYANGKLLDLSRPQIMAIVNLTHDSFYEGSRFKDLSRVINAVEKFIKEGASIIDIGAVSSRPFADPVTEKEELNRILPVIEEIRKSFPDVFVSVDTVRSEVAKQCIDKGVDIINDISGGNEDPLMDELMAKTGLPYIIMHMQGNPQTMQINPHYEDLILDILKFFSKTIHMLKLKGINQIIIDPGIGFGKTIEHNFKLLKSLSSFKIFDLPILLGVSRKSLIYKCLHIDADQSLNGTTALHSFGLLNGANILRVHDVREAKECIELCNVYQSQ